MSVIDQPFQEDKAPHPPGHPRILSLANQKGGVGKTTTAINLGTALAAIGERVLIVDLDPQGNASTGLGIDRKSRNTSTYDVLVGEAPLRDSVVPTAVPRLHIATSTMDLSGLELELGTTPGRAFLTPQRAGNRDSGKAGPCSEVGPDFCLRCEIEELKRVGDVT